MTSVNLVPNSQLFKCAMVALESVHFFETTPKDFGRSNCGTLPIHSVKPALPCLQAATELPIIKSQDTGHSQQQSAPSAAVADGDSCAGESFNRGLVLTVQVVHKSCGDSAHSVTKAGYGCRTTAISVCRHVTTLLWFLLDAVLSGTLFVTKTRSCTERAKS